VHRELPQDDPRQRQPEITQARDKLAWQPKVQLRDGLAQTIAYFRVLIGQGWREERA
jgi:UDP-glucuronate decarboxylase